MSDTGGKRVVAGNGTFAKSFCQGRSERVRERRGPGRYHRDRCRTRNCKVKTRIRRDRQSRVRGRERVVAAVENRLSLLLLRLVRRPACIMIRFRAHSRESLPRRDVGFGARRG